MVLTIKVYKCNPKLQPSMNRKEEKREVAAKSRVIQ